KSSAIRSCAFSFARQGKITVSSATMPVASRTKPAANPAIFKRSGNRRMGEASIGPTGGFRQVFELTCTAVFVKVRAPMQRDRARVDEALVEAIRAVTEPAEDAEIRAALANLTSGEEKKLRQLLQHPPKLGLGPFGWADLARGTDPQVAAARELSGYYQLLSE